MHRQNKNWFIPYVVMIWIFTQAIIIFFAFVGTESTNNPSYTFGVVLGASVFNTFAVGIILGKEK